jgi:hypothetical protein
MLTKMNWTIPNSPWESLRVTARDKKVRRPGRERVSSRETLRPCGGAIAFPVFESYGDRIMECLAALGEGKPARAAAKRVTRSLLSAAASAERVRKSPRHSSMACLMRHTLEAMRATEWEGARYLLMTALALMNARAVPAGGWLNSPEGGGVVLQFPLPPAARTTEPETEDATTGMVTG